jgi:hypothetical protein
MTAQEIAQTLQPLGTEGYRRILRSHGVPEPLFGVKVQDLKQIQKTVKKDYRLALELYQTGVYDLRYLACLIADEKQMTPDDLRAWMRQANCDAVAGIVVAWTAADSPHGWMLGREWIEAPDEQTEAAGWSALSGWVAVHPDSELDLLALKGLLQRVQTTIHGRPNQTRFAMNGFVISVGTHVAPLADEAVAVAQQIGPVQVDMGETSCKVPSAPEYIRKVAAMGRTGKKRKMVRC